MAGFVGSEVIQRYSRQNLVQRKLCGEVTALLSKNGALRTDPLLIDLPGRRDEPRRRAEEDEQRGFDRFDQAMTDFCNARCLDARNPRRSPLSNRH